MTGQRFMKPATLLAGPRFVSGADAELWRGVAFMFNPVQPRGGGTSTLLDSKGAPLSGSNLTMSASAAWKGSPYGLALGAINNTDMRRLLQANFAPITTSDGAGTGDFTLMIFCNPAASGAKKKGVMQIDWSSGYEEACLAFNASSTDTVLSGSAQFLTYNTALSAVAAADAVDGKWHVWMGVRQGTVMTLARDGVSIASSSLTLRNVYSATSDFCIGGHAGVTNEGLDVTDDIALAIGWNRALSNFEMWLLGQDPFRMFPRGYPLVVKAASGFQPAWAANSNYLIGGVAA